MERDPVTHAVERGAQRLDLLSERGEVVGAGAQGRALDPGRLGERRERRAPARLGVGQPRERAELAARRRIGRGVGGDLRDQRAPGRGAPGVAARDVHGIEREAQLGGPADGGVDPRQVELERVSAQIAEPAPRGLVRGLPRLRPLLGSSKAAGPESHPMSARRESIPDRRAALGGSCSVFAAIPRR